MAKNKITSIENLMAFAYVAGQENNIEDYKKYIEEARAIDRQLNNLFKRFDLLAESI